MTIIAERPQSPPIAALLEPPCLGRPPRSEVTPRSLVMDAHREVSNEWGPARGTGREAAPGPADARRSPGPRPSERPRVALGLVAEDARRSLEPRPSAPQRVALGLAADDANRSPGPRPSVRERVATALVPHGVDAAGSGPVPEFVIGEDDRREVTAIHNLPWRCICALWVIAADGTRLRGTGWLAGPRTVITAGHCLFLPRHGGWVRHVEVAPAARGHRRPYGSVGATRFRSVEGWIRDQRPSSDYGAILLPEQFVAGQTLGHLGFAALPTARLQELEVHVSGYPGDKPSGTQWWHARTVDEVTARHLVYDVDTAGGQSGAPVWVDDEAGPVVVGIHASGSLQGNLATRITAPVFSNLLRWKQAGASAMTPGSASAAEDAARVPRVSRQPDGR